MATLAEAAKAIMAVVDNGGLSISARLPFVMDRVYGTPTGDMEFVNTVRSANQIMLNGTADYTYGKNQGYVDPTFQGSAINAVFDYLKDLTAAILRAQEVQLSQNKFIYPTFAELVDTASLKTATAPVIAWSKSTDVTPSVLFKSTYREFQKNYEKILTNARKMDRNREAYEEAMQNAPMLAPAPTTYPVQAPSPAPVSNSPIQFSSPAEKVATDKAVAEPNPPEVREYKEYITEFVTTEYRAKFFVRKNWWVFVGAAVLLYGVSVYRARRRARQE